MFRNQQELKGGNNHCEGTKLEASYSTKFVIFFLLSSGYLNSNLSTQCDFTLVQKTTTHKQDTKIFPQNGKGCRDGHAKKHSNKV